MHSSHSLKLCRPQPCKVDIHIERIEVLRLSDLPKCVQLEARSKPWLPTLKPSTLASLKVILSPGCTAAHMALFELNPFSSRTPLCVCVCLSVCTYTHVCTLGTYTRKNAKRKVRGSEEKHPICYNFAWAVPVSKYHDNIFWSKDQRTYGLTRGLTKGKYLKLEISGTIWDVRLQ